MSDLPPATMDSSSSPPQIPPIPPSIPQPQHQQQQQKKEISPDEPGGVRKDREEWSEAAISTLIDAYTAKYGQLNGKGLRSKDWGEVVEAVNSNQKSAKTVEHCRNKMDTLTKRYKSEKKNRLAGADSSSWPWYDKMEIIRGCSPAKSSSATARPPPPPPPPPPAPPAPKDKPSRAKRGKKPQSPVDDGETVGNNKYPAAAAVVMGRLEAAVPAWHSSPPAVVAAAAGHNAMPQLAAAAAAARAACEQGSGGGGGGEGEMARSISELAASLKAATGNLASSINGFTEVYARVEIAKMEMLKELELKRMQMQVDAAEILRESTSGGKRKREASSDRD